MKTIKVKNTGDIPENYTGIAELASGTRQWFLNGIVHRKEGPCTMCKDCLKGNFVLCTKPGPAVERADGYKIWYLNGKLHRENGPAIVYPSGVKKWFLNDELHREDGPTVEYPDGTKEYWLNDKQANKQAVELHYMLKYKREF